MDFLAEASDIAAQRWAATEKKENKSERELLRDQIIEAALRMQPVQEWEVTSVCPVEGTDVYVVSIWKLHQHPNGGGSILLKVVFVKWDSTYGYIGKDADRI